MLDTSYEPFHPHPHSFLHQRALARVIAKIRESLNLETIFQTTTSEVRQLLDADRVGVVQLDPATGWDSGQFIAEDVLPKFDRVLAKRVQDQCFGEDYVDAYAKGRIHAMTDVQSADISGCHREILNQFQVRANLLVPLHCGTTLWGLLCIHQCSGPRQWQPVDVDFVAQIASHLSIAIQQSQLLQETQRQADEISQNLRDLQQLQLQLVQAEKMSTLGQLAAGVAHEINNPVNFISGNLHHIRTYSQQLLQMLHVYEKHCPKGITEVEEAIAQFDIDFLSHDLPKLLNSMSYGTSRIESIVKTLRNFTGLDESGLKLIDINQCLDNVIAMVQHRLAPHTHRTEVQLTKTYASLPQIKGIPATLNQVFMNILTNALDALDGLMGKPTHHLSHEKNTPRIHISTSHQEDTITVSIMNNGSTIPEHIVEKLFEPFFTTKPIGQATGMGLAISQKIVAFHKGTIQYMPNSKGETVFQVTLPIIN